MNNIYDIMVTRLAEEVRAVANYGNVDINIAYYKEGDMTITIHDEMQSPHFYAIDVDEHGRVFQEWYKEEQEDPWLYCGPSHFEDI